MYCEACDKPVAAQKQTHKARSLLLGPLTYGAAVKVGEWHCPDCGGPVIPIPYDKKPDSQKTWLERKLFDETDSKGETSTAQVEESGPRVDVLASIPIDRKVSTREEMHLVRAIQQAKPGRKRKELRALRARLVTGEVKVRGRGTSELLAEALGPTAAADLREKLEAAGADVELRPCEPEPGAESEAKHAADEAGSTPPPQVTVKLIDSGRKKIQVIKALRGITGLSLSDAKAAVDGVPTLVAESVTPAHAERLRVALEDAGAEVEISEQPPVSDGEGESTAAAPAPEPAEAIEPDVEPAPGGDAHDPADQIRKLGELRDEGLLTDEEFAAKKAELLDRL